MAASTSSQQRAELIREMSRDMNRTRNSSGSSRHSQGVASPEPTTSDFDPENEAIMSTRQLDNPSQHLPQLRASAQKYSRFARSSEPDFAINTSAIGRAFPDFSQGGTSSDEDSLSIEIGRGAKKGSSGTIGKLGRSREYSSNAQLSFDGDSMDFSAPMIGNYEVTTTPPLTQRHTSKRTENSALGLGRRESQVRKPSGLQKETFDPSPPPSKTKDYDSGESRKASKEGHRTLSSMHARVKEEIDQSHISEERPPNIDLTTRNTRFGNPKTVQPSSQGALPTRFSSAQTLLNSVAPINKQKLQSAVTPIQGTQQSFMLPDLPNISELVSGVFEDGTPVFSRHGKSRASRFVSASQDGRSKGQQYAGIDEIPVPDDEQAIFLSIKLLQDKVLTLEKGNAEAANTIEELEQKNKVLEGERKNWKRSSRNDSALGTTDSDGSHNAVNGQRKLQIEKNRLESSTRTLQQQVDAWKRKYSTAETILKNITQERDSAVSQLVVAYGTVEQLKHENESLKEENIELKARIVHMSNHHEDGTQEWTAKEGSHRRKLATRAEAVSTMKEEPKAQEFGAQQASGPTKERSQEFMETPGQYTKALANEDANTMFDLSSSQYAKSVPAKASRHHIQIDDDQETEDAVNEAPVRRAKGKDATKSSRRSHNVQDDEASRDLTYLSFIDNQEIAQLRRTLEQERIERQQRQNRNRGPLRADDTVTQPGPVESKPQSSQQAVPRKSSMKDLTTKSAQDNEATHTSLHLSGHAEHNRRHSDNSMLSLRGRRRALDAENMTSAFIVPDITIRATGIASHQVPELTKEAQEVLDRLASHNSHNCTICKRAVGVDKHHDLDEVTEEKIKITRPICVSERMPKATADEGDPTIRPSQAPGLALATVLNELEDELAHLKIQLAQYQALYNGHDPALSKRKRKSVQQQIETIMQTIDVKADQIYALYDVLEGQKQHGHEISEEEVEITLQSIGVKAPELKLRGGGEEEVKNANERHPWDLESDAESGDDLPWEGIESTVETTKGGSVRAARRKNSNASGL